MGVTERTRNRLSPVSLRGPLVLGALLVVVLLTVFVAPCEGRLCDRPDAFASSSPHATAPDQTALPTPDTAAHCAVHCGQVLLPLLLVIVAPVLATRVPLAALTLRLHITAPPLLPPPQYA